MIIDGSPVWFVEEYLAVAQGLSIRVCLLDAEKPLGMSVWGFGDDDLSTWVGHEEFGGY